MNGRACRKRRKSEGKRRRKTKRSELDKEVEAETMRNRKIMKWKVEIKWTKAIEDYAEEKEFKNSLFFYALSSIPHGLCLKM
jgi:hypothetical protein